MAHIPLWELSEDGRPCVFADNETRFATWSEFREHVDTFDDHLNVVIWWDWDPPNDEDPGDNFAVMLALPSRERVANLNVDVTRDQEPEIRAWLNTRLDRLIGWWQIRDQEPG